jgi:hypothetical protein
LPLHLIGPSRSPDRLDPNRANLLTGFVQLPAPVSCLNSAQNKIFPFLFKTLCNEVFLLCSANLLVQSHLLPALCSASTMASAQPPITVLPMGKWFIKSVQDVKLEAAIKSPWRCLLICLLIFGICSFTGQTKDVEAFPQQSWLVARGHFRP